MNTYFSDFLTVTPVPRIFRSCSLFITEYVPESMASIFLLHFIPRRASTSTPYLASSFSRFLLAPTLANSFTFHVVYV